jgi:8-oxo-dGTP diphosphatase
MPLLLVRHARAGEASAWKGDDRERPLDERGVVQARALVELLGPYPVETIYSSPARRCIQTVEPLAAARGLTIEERDELGEKRQSSAGIDLVHSLAGKDVVVCGHGGLDDALREAEVDPPKWKKGMTFVVGPDLRVSAVLFPST